jgi:transposase
MAEVGLVPRQSRTGGRINLLGISKRGDRYLRTLLIHGARAALRWGCRLGRGRSLAQGLAGTACTRCGDRSSGQQDGARYLGSARPRANVSKDLRRVDNGLP